MRKILVTILMLLPILAFSTRPPVDYYGRTYRYFASTETDFWNVTYEKDARPGWCSLDQLTIVTTDDVDLKLYLRPYGIRGLTESFFPDVRPIELTLVRKNLFYYYKPINVSVRCGTYTLDIEGPNETYASISLPILLTPYGCYPDSITLLTSKRFSYEDNWFYADNIISAVVNPEPFYENPQEWSSGIPDVYPNISISLRFLGTLDPDDISRRTISAYVKAMRDVYYYSDKKELHVGDVIDVDSSKYTTNIIVDSDGFFQVDMNITKIEDDWDVVMPCVEIDYIPMIGPPYAINSFCYYIPVAPYVKNPFIWSILFPWNNTVDVETGYFLLSVTSDGIEGLWIPQERTILELYGINSGKRMFIPSESVEYKFGYFVYTFNVSGEYINRTLNDTMFLVSVYWYEPYFPYHPTMLNVSEIVKKYWRKPEYFQVRNVTYASLTCGIERATTLYNATQGTYEDKIRLWGHLVYTNTSVPVLNATCKVDLQIKNKTELLFSNTYYLTYNPDREEYEIVIDAPAYGDYIATFDCWKWNNEIVVSNTCKSKASITGPLSVNVEYITQPTQTILDIMFTNNVLYVFLVAALGSVASKKDERIGIGIFIIGLIALSLKGLVSWLITLPLIVIGISMYGIFAKPSPKKA